jgi:hypothetical protein
VPGAAQPPWWHLIVDLPSDRSRDSDQMADPASRSIGQSPDLAPLDAWADDQVTM